MATLRLLSSILFLCFFLSGPAASEGPAVTQGPAAPDGPASSDGPGASDGPAATEGPGTTEEPPAPEAPVYCSSGVIPGIERMARGIDITELDLTPSDLQSANGYRATVIDFTCKDGRIWVNPTADATQYSRPDQIAGVNTLPAGQLKAHHEISGDSEEYKRAKSLKVGLAIDTVRFGAYSASVGLKNVQENLYRSNRSVAETTATVSAIQVDFKTQSHLKLTDEFTEFIPTVPKVPTYEESPELYDSFVRTFGTHYFARAIFGGYLYQKTAIDEKYRMSSDESEITSNLEASFGGKVKITSETADIKKTVSDSFAQNTQTEFFYYGGIPVTMDPEHPTAWMEHWLPTVNKDPWLFSGELRPIEELIANQQVKGEVKKALTLKMARAYLEELKYTVTIGQFTLSAEEQRTMEETEKKLNSQDQKEIQEMLQQLETIFATVRSIRDRSRLHQLLETWNPTVRDIIGCKSYIVPYCFPAQSDSSGREYGQVSRLTEQVAILLIPRTVDHEKTKRVLSEAGKLLAQLEKPAFQCPPKNVDWGKWMVCNNCIKVSADKAYNEAKLPLGPFCRTKEAWKAIGQTPSR